MNRNIPDSAMEASEQALDAALTRTLSAPQVPAAFRAQLHAALARAEQASVVARAELERERLQRLSMLERGYRQLRRRMFAVLGAAAVVAAVAVMLLMPWFTGAAGAHATAVVAVCATIAGVIVGAAAWARHMGMPELIQLF